MLAQSASKVLSSCRVNRNDNGTVTATYTFGDAYAAAIKPIIISGANDNQLD